MRTTLTLDPDVAQLLRKAVASGKNSFKDVVNQALRIGLTAHDDPAKPKKRFVQRTFAGGEMPPWAEIKERMYQEDIEKFNEVARRQPSRLRD
ncbi:MAG: hypothetical protein ABI665_15195 [Vicinamibacterales bacterium]